MIAKKINNWLVFSLVLINVLLCSSIVISWYSASKIESNFNSFSGLVENDLHNLSQTASSLSKDLGGIQEKIGGLTGAIEELKTIEGELGGINSNLDGVKENLDKVAEIKGELLKLENDLQGIVREVANLGGGVNSEELVKLKEEITKLGGVAEKLGGIICPDCQGIKVSFLKLLSSRASFEPEKWKKLFGDKKLSIFGEIETFEYWKVKTLIPWKPSRGPTVTKEVKINGLDNTFIREIEEFEDSYPPELGERTREEINRNSCKKFTLQKKGVCNLCSREIGLQGAEDCKKQQIIDLFNG